MPKRPITNICFKLLVLQNYKVRVGSTLSETYGQDKGVLQGSILSVTVFSLKIINIAHCLNPNVDSFNTWMTFLTCDM